jgi:RTX calcium-binding nonapeptide repeat (4 copies)/Glycosyl hydrolase family 12
MVDQVSDLRELSFTTDIDIGGETTGFNVAYDLWFTDTPAGDPDSITSEMMIWLHKGGFTPAGAPVARYVGQDVSATVWFEAAVTSGPDKRPSYIALVVDGGQLDGSIDMAAMLRFLVRKGLVDGDDYLSCVELGPELQRGAGFLTLNSLDYTHSRYAITAGADSLIGTDTGDMVDGRGGNDTIRGAAGWDRLSGNTGDDWLVGGRGNDRLDGGAGADSLQGGAGDDSLTGAAGADRFLWYYASKGDVITDFATGDRIDLRAIDSDTGRTGNQTFDFIGSAAFTGTAGDLRSVISGGQTRILADIDGDRQADLIITLDNAVALRATDVLL